MTDIDERLKALSPERRAALLQKARDMRAASRGAAAASEVEVSPRLKAQGIDFSLIFFSGNGSSEEAGKYDLLIEAAKFADENGFSAIITPERHLQPVGGLFPNPSVLSAALAMVTQQIQLRAGSVIIPLHNPIRVAEEWSLVDNLSGGRAAISLATGWHPADFVLEPERYEDRRAVLFENVALIRKLWRGETVTRTDVVGNPIKITTLPRPIQHDLPMFLTSSGNPETWRKAGEMGVNVLCSLTNHSLETLASSVALYRAARADNNHDPAAGIVSTMVHTYVGRQDDEVKEKVRAPLRAFLNGYINQNDTLNPFRNTNKTVQDVIENDRETLLHYAFEKHFTQTSLMGSPHKCAAMVEALHRAGVNEIACLVDFGLPQNEVLDGLARLAALKAHYPRPTGTHATMAAALEGGYAQ